MKDEKQPKASLAIAYSVQRKNKRKMAQGGAISAAEEKRPMPGEEDNDADLAKRQAKSASSGPNFASENEADIDDEADSIADAILRKRRNAKMMAEGGQVDLEENSEEAPNFEDDASFEANGKEQYDDSQLSAQPQDSNEHGDDISADEHDMISRIRAKLRAKRGM